ncbi:MAG: S8 family serine peptidase, partial [Thermoprotei archaeon]
GTDFQLLHSLQMAIDLGADIVSASWGSAETSQLPEQDPYYKPINIMVQQYNIIFVAASGDSGPGVSPSTPAAVPDALSVGSINAVGNQQSAFGPAGEVSGFSGRGPTPWGAVYPDTATYGAIIDSAITGWMRASYEGVPHEYVAIAGTSMSTPIAAGLITLMRQAYKAKVGGTLTTSEIKTMLSTTGLQYWNQRYKNNDVGWGPINWPIFQQYMQEKYGVTV